LKSTETKEPQDEQAGQVSTCFAAVADEKATAEFLLVVAVLRQETFGATIDGTWYLWDVTLANELLDKRNAPVERFKPANWDICEEHILERYPDLDVDYARELTDEDMARPMLFIPLGENHQLLDGWHRLYKAVTSGIDTLPARVLNEQEARKILLDSKPVGNAAQVNRNHEPAPSTLTAVRLWT
jgi:hypothetical protein